MNSFLFKTLVLLLILAFWGGWILTLLPMFGVGGSLIVYAGCGLVIVAGCGGELLRRAQP